MKATVKLPITSGDKILVKTGDKVGPGTILAETKPVGLEQTIFLSQLLHVNPSMIHRYLKKGVGENAELGDLLAEKKGLFSTSRVKSPTSGKISQIDLKKGTLTFLTRSTEKTRGLTLPVLGKITHIDKDYIEVEIEGKILEAHKGYGQEALGSLIYLTAKTVGVFDVDKDVNESESVVLANAISEEAVVKLEVMGVVGFIIQKSADFTALPWLQVDEETFETLTTHVDKKVWLRPEKKQIVIIE